MATAFVNRDLLAHLKHEAERVAGQRGHRLAPFRNARHDPLRYVSFCTACGGLVIVETGPGDDLANRLHGHAWDSDCACLCRPPAQE